MSDFNLNQARENEKLIKYCQDLTKSFENINALQDKFDDKTLKALETNLNSLKKLCTKRKDYFENLILGLNTSEILTSLLIKCLSNVDQDLSKIKVLMISCLADISHFTTLRNQIASDTNCDKLCKLFSNELDEQVWSKICRFAANLSQEKSNIRYFLDNTEFIVCLARLLQKSSLENIDLYFCLIRFLKYGCEKTKFRNEILSKRILVYVCKFMSKNKTNKYVKDEFMRQFFNLIDLWLHSSSVEFSNQIVEGETMDFLLWIYMENHVDKPIYLEIKKCSFNLIHKFCKEYDACRAEFGRINGIKKFIELIKEDSFKEKERVIEILCFACKESVNRHRFKEQHLLSELMILLKSNIKENLNLSEKLINSICSFAHDHDALNYFLQNSIVDYLIDYLSTQFNSKIEKSIFSNESFEEKYQKLLKCDHKSDLCALQKTISINDLITDTGASDVKPNKRKVDCQIPINKRTKFSASINNLTFLSSSPPRLVSPIYEVENLLSPSYSFSPLSYSESMSSFSPIPSFSPTGSCRSNSANMFDASECEEKSIQFSPSISLCDTFNDENEDTDVKALETSFTSVQTTNTLRANIENINKTEACIFYVFSLLSYGQFPSNYLLNEKFFDFLLSYLKSASIRNPRALRIINRLTKNPQCFQYFLVNQFSYKLKHIFGSYTNEDETTTTTNENEMQNYLNSNNVFFEANVFPRLSSIEFQLNQNLKLHCLTSSDNCYQSLLNLLKYGTLRERQSCALQMPFILRNCKALENVMLHLNGLDLILDCIFQRQESSGDDFFKALLALHKILKFVNYKQNVKSLKESNDKFKLKCLQVTNNKSLSSDTIEFLIDTQEGVKVLEADRNGLIQKCEYFNLMLNGSFMESCCNKKQIHLKDMNYHALKCIFRLLDCVIDSSNEINLIEINFNLCSNLIETCDRLMLFDLKLYLSSFTALMFLSKCTIDECFCLAIQFDCKYLLNVCVEYLLTYENSCVSNEDSFIEYCFYFKNAIQASFASNFNLRSTIKNAVCDIVKFNTWKY